MVILYIGFADDTSALAESPEDLQTLVKIMAEVFKEIFHPVIPIMEFAPNFRKCLYCKDLIIAK